MIKGLASAAFKDTWFWSLLAIDLRLHCLDLFLEISIFLLVEIPTIRRERREQREETLEIVSQFAKLFEDGPRQHLSIGVELLFQPKQRGGDRRKDTHRFQYNLFILREGDPIVPAGFKWSLHI